MPGIWGTEHCTTPSCGLTIEQNCIWLIKQTILVLLLESKLTMVSKFSKVSALISGNNLKLLGQSWEWQAVTFPICNTLVTCSSWWYHKSLQSVSGQRIFQLPTVSGFWKKSSPRKCLGYTERQYLVRLKGSLSISFSEI